MSSEVDQAVHQTAKGWPVGRRSLGRGAGGWKRMGKETCYSWRVVGRRKPCCRSLVIELGEDVRYDVRRRMGKGQGITGYGMGRLASGRCCWLRHGLSSAGMVQVEACLGVGAMNGMCKSRGGSALGALGCVR